MSTPSRRRAVSGLKLTGLGGLGIALVTIPVTLALLFAAPATSPKAPRSVAPTAVVLWDGPALPASSIHPAAAVDAIRCRPTRGWYALTFDGGPLPVKTRALVAAIRRAHAVATFFVVGQQAAAHPALLDLERHVGVVANHSFTHVNLARVSHARRIEEMRATAKALGHPNSFIRPPFGATDPATFADIRASGLIPVFWTVHTRDATARDAALVVRRALAVRPGGILLFNEGIDATIDAIPTIVRELRERGLCPGLLAAAKAPVTGAGGRTFQVQAVKP